MDNPFSKLSKPQLYATIAGGLGIGGYMVYRHHKSTGSWNPWSKGTPATGGGSSATDPVTGLPYSQDTATDPATGQQYLAEAQQYGSVAAAEASVSAFGQSTASGSGVPVNPASPASSGSINTPVGTSVYTSNAAWAQAAQAGLTDVGYDGPTVAAALGAYLTQTPVTPAQAQLISTAIAEYGPAPVGNLQVIQAPAAQPSPTPPPAPAPAPAPSQVSRYPAPPGLHVVSKTSSTVTVAWKAVTPPAQSYTVAAYQDNGVRAAYQTVDVPDMPGSGGQVELTGLHSRWHYTIEVWANGGTQSPPHSTVSVTLS